MQAHQKWYQVMKSYLIWSRFVKGNSGNPIWLVSYNLWFLQDICKIHQHVKNKLVALQELEASPSRNTRASSLFSFKKSGKKSKFLELVQVYFFGFLPPKVNKYPISTGITKNSGQSSREVGCFTKWTWRFSRHSSNRDKKEASDWRFRTTTTTRKKGRLIF